MIRNAVFFVLATLSAVVCAFAQTATASSRLTWDQAAPSLAIAQGYVYEALFDGATTPTVLVETCVGAASPFVCDAPLPALTTGNHSVRVRAVDNTTVPGTRLESPLSALFNFTLVALPSAPGSIRIVTIP